MEAHVSKSPTVNFYQLITSATGNLKEGPLVQILMWGARQPSSRKPLTIFTMRPQEAYLSAAKEFIKLLELCQP